MTRSASTVPFDEELGEFLWNLQSRGSWPPLSRETVHVQRLGQQSKSTPEVVLTDDEITHNELVIPGPDGNQITLSILRHRDSVVDNSPVCFYVHGGGMVSGSRLSGVSNLFPWIKQFNVVVVSIEYRLAPEHPYPAAIRDCYAGLSWLSDQGADVLKTDSKRIIVVGDSAGGGIATGTMLMARDRGGPKVLAQCLMCPMLDSRMVTASSQQFMNLGLWTGVNNIAGWEMYLNGLDVSSPEAVYASPVLATDLVGLPQTFIDVGSAEVFRDEDIAFGMKLSEQGVPVEMHVWSGAWHGFDQLCPGARVSKACKAARLAWIQRILVDASPRGERK